MDRALTAPTTQQCIKGIGISSAPPPIRPFLKPHDCFPQLGVPRKGEWRFVRHEKPQAFLQYKRVFQKLKKQISNKKIYLVCLGSDFLPYLADLGKLVSLFYCVAVEILPPIPILKEEDPTYHVNYAKKNFTIQRRDTRIATADVEKLLMYTMKNLHQDASFIMCLTPTGIYADDGTTLFGEADPDKYVGVVACTHLGQDPTLGLSRIGKTLIHEIGHLYGLAHCCYYQCIMQGTKGLKEIDKNPLYLCPVCLHKAHYALDFCIPLRYENLHNFYVLFDDPQFTELSVWIQKRRHFCSGID